MELIHNTVSWRVMISDSFTIFRSLNKGRECSVKLEKVLDRTHRASTVSTRI